MSNKLKRIVTDAGGYGLILLGIATGWLPGPGGIPLVLAGLGLLSINNAWAKAIREWLMENSGKAVKILFPDNTFVQILYDIAVVLLLILTGVLTWRHAAIRQISLAIFSFFIGLLVALMNRDRLERFKHRRKKI